MSKRWEGSRPRDPWFPKPTAFPNQGRTYIVGFGKVLAARGDPTSPNATTNGRKTTGYVGSGSCRTRPPQVMGQSCAFHPGLPPHQPYPVWRDVDPAIQLLPLKQVKSRLSECDRL